MPANGTNGDVRTVKVAKTATIKDETILEIDLLGDTVLLIPIPEEEAQKVNWLVNREVIELREIAIADGEDRPELRVLAPEKKISLPVPDDALEYHDDFFAVA